MILERKVTLNEYGSRHSIEGLISIKIASRLSMTPEVARDAVVNHIKGELQASHSAGSFSEQKYNIYAKDMELMAQLPIVYHKETRYDGLDGDIYYVQMLLDLSALHDPCVTPSSYSLLPDIAAGILGAVYGGYGMRVTPRCPLTDFTYELANIKFGSRNTVLRSEQGTQFCQFVYSQVNIPKNNIAIAIEANTQKAYNRNSLIKVQYKIYDDFVEALNDKSINTLSISQHDGVYGVLTFTTLGEHHNGVYRFDVMYKGKVMAYWYKDTLVCYDGLKSLETVKPYLEEWTRGGIKQVDILQFCANRDFFYQDEMNSEFNRVNKMVLHFLGKNRLYLSRSGLNYRNGGLTGQIYYKPAKARKVTAINTTLKSIGQTFFAELVIAVDGIHGAEEAMSKAVQLIRARIFPNENLDVNLAFTEYKHTLFEAEEVQDDVLSKWFSYCTKSSKTTDDGIIRAYLKMKANLEKEYKEIASYLTCYDFSKCTAVPRLEMDKKLRENCYKSLHVEPKNVIIKSINNKKINPISETRPIVKFMVSTKGMCAIGEMPLKKYYDAKSNAVLLNYNKMKGEVIRDKIKNRR